MTEEKVPKRYVPEIPFPSYSFVPGNAPHPTRDPEGHSFEEEKEDIALVPAPDPDNWRQSKLYLYGIDLFNHGYYWETHEAWEDLWHALGRIGDTANFLKAMIHLAAAGLKAKNGQWDAMRKHAHRTTMLLTDIKLNLKKSHPNYMGLPVGQLIQWAQTIAEKGDLVIPDAEETDGPVFEFYLKPE